jgi:hypothetical protein
MKLFLKGERCHSEKCAIERRNFVPGQHGKDRKAKIVVRSVAKKKVRRVYGVGGSSAVLEGGACQPRASLMSGLEAV